MESGMRNELLDEFVERVRAESDILAVVSSYVSMKRKGNRYWAAALFIRKIHLHFRLCPIRVFFIVLAVMQVEMFSNSFQ